MLPPQSIGTCVHVAVRPCLACSTFPADLLRIPSRKRKKGSQKWPVPSALEQEAAGQLPSHLSPMFPWLAIGQNFGDLFQEQHPQTPGNHFQNALPSLLGSPLLGNGGDRNSVSRRVRQKVETENLQGLFFRVRYSITMYPNADCLIWIETKFIALFDKLGSRSTLGCFNDERLQTLFRNQLIYNFVRKQKWMRCNNLFVLCSVPKRNIMPKQFQRSSPAKAPEQIPRQISKLPAFGTCPCKLIHRAGTASFCCSRLRYLKNIFCRQLIVQEGLPNFFLQRWRLCFCSFASETLAALAFAADDFASLCRFRVGRISLSPRTAWPVKAKTKNIRKPSARQRDTTMFPEEGLRGPCMSMLYYMLADMYGYVHVHMCICRCICIFI